MKEAEALYEQADRKIRRREAPYDDTVGETAKTELFEIRHLTVGKEAAGHRRRRTRTASDSS